MSDWKKLRELAEAATPGPWRWGDSLKERNGVQEKMMNLYSDAPRSDGDVRIIPIIWLEPSSGWNTLHDNAEWIAAANPTTIIALLDENDSLRAEVERLRASVSAHGEALRYLAYWKGDDQDHSNAEEIAAGNMVIGEDGKAIGKDGGNG